MLVTVNSAKPREGIDFFPLTVDYMEKIYAAGKIPGGFFKRERGMTEKEVLTSRFIDRALRPLFPDGYRDETQVTAQVISADPDYDTDVLAFVGASAAVMLSDVPFPAPIARGARLARRRQADRERNPRRDRGRGPQHHRRRLAATRWSWSRAARSRSRRPRCSRRCASATRRS